MHLKEFIQTVENEGFEVYVIPCTNGCKVNSYDDRGQLTLWANISTSDGQIENIELVSHYHFISYNQITSDDVKHFIKYKLQ